MDQKVTLKWQDRAEFKGPGSWMGERKAGSSRSATSLLEAALAGAIFEQGVTYENRSIAKQNRNALLPSGQQIKKLHSQTCEEEPLTPWTTWARPAAVYFPQTAVNSGVL